MNRLFLRAALAAFILPTAQALASELTILGSYAPTARSTPSGGVVPDGNGGVVSVDRMGGAPHSNGAVLDFAPPASGTGAWTVSTLYQFAGGADGAYPIGGLLPDGAGGYYGTTYKGGSSGVGTVYHLSPPSTPGGAWVHTVLYSFQGGATDAAGPQGNLVFDASGNLIGSAIGTGASGPAAGGAVYRLSPPATLGGAWTEQPLALFAGAPADGNSPRTPVLDASGAIYVACLSGGAENLGEILVLTPQSGGLYAKTVLHTFTKAGMGRGDGHFPYVLSEDASGTLYGLTQQGGANKVGTYFALSNAGGSWTETILYNFGATATDAASPKDPLYVDTDGSLLGVAQGGANNAGAIYRLTNSGGIYSSTVLYSFPGGSGGASPKGALVPYGNGNFIGNTEKGGTKNDGTVYSFTP